MCMYAFSHEPRSMIIVHPVPGDTTFGSNSSISEILIMHDLAPPKTKGSVIGLFTLVFCTCENKHLSISEIYFNTLKFYLLFWKFPGLLFTFLLLPLGAITLWDESVHVQPLPQYEKHISLCDSDQPINPAVLCYCSRMC